MTEISDVTQSLLGMVVRGWVCFTETFSEVQFRFHAGPGGCPLFNRRMHLGAPYPPAPLLATTTTPPPAGCHWPHSGLGLWSLLLMPMPASGSCQREGLRPLARAGRSGVRAGSFGFAEKSFKSKPFRERDRGVSRRKGLHHRQNSGLSSQVRKKTPLCL